MIPGENTPHKGTYGGFYQALAWTEGANGPTTVNVPDELFDDTTDEWFDFNMVDFMTLAADFDDQGIHYFRFATVPMPGYENDLTIDQMTIYCTESDYWYNEESELFVKVAAETITETYTSHGWLAIHAALKINEDEKAHEAEGKGN